MMIISTLSLPLLAIAIAMAMSMVMMTDAFSPLTQNLSHKKLSPTPTTMTTLAMSEWSDFQALDDDDDDLYNDSSSSSSPPIGKMSEMGYADENDPQEYKAEIGSTIAPPSVSWDGEPLFLPQGSVLELSEENVEAVLAACRIEIGTMFGYTAENRGVGITGGVDFVELDGPTVILTLHGRFWHQRTTVLERVGKYIQGRIPEVIDFGVLDEYELTDEANDEAY